MPNTDPVAISRRTLLQVAAVGSGIVLGAWIPSAGAAAAPAGAAAEGSGLEGFIDIDGVHAEYRAAISNFRLPLPTGWSFPAESAVREPEPNVMWEQGTGEFEAYLYWQRAVATAAQDAHLRGDDAEADRLLDALESGYNSSTRRGLIDDPDNLFVTVTIGPARGGNPTARGGVAERDFSRLMEAVHPA
ncbi:hypothetical protein [Microbacterium ureisolvens]|uniref:Uncharacterized protein n=1 Tax=Microbacterium ureisolvens TaxID=2781186 RepID=A0ABS7HXP9_9MICO|nr:hypothetical protein [Microbacterium ureisolvens]MBW9110157.1 hypothetical protein [Microbacterium ureisolvens]